MNRVVAAFGRADRPGAPDVTRLGALGIVAALAVRAADRVDRREVDDVEAELRELRDDPCHAGEPAPGSREQLVPGARAGALPLHLDLERATARRLAAITRPERRCRGAPLLDRSRAEERRPFRQLACEVGLPRRDLAVVLVEPAGVPVDPRLDLEAPAPDGIDVEGSREAVVAERLERRLAPAAPGPAVADDAAERLVPVPGDRGVDLDAVADARLRGPAAAVDLRRDVGHVDALGSHLRHTVNSPACAWNGHSASSSIRPRFRAGAWGRRRMRSSTGSRTRARAGGRCCRSTRRTSSAPRTRPRPRSRCWNGLLADPDAPVAPSDARAFSKRERSWLADWEAFSGDGAVAEQVRFDREWGALRSYAASRGVRVIGDVPIYVAAGGCDHAAHPDLFLPLDEVTAGAPPDDLSALGQLWGNPLYDWERDGPHRLPLVDRPDAPRARARRPLSGSTTFAASPPTGPSRRTPSRHATAGGRPGRGPRSSAPPRRISGRCR